MMISMAIDYCYDENDTDLGTGTDNREAED